MKPDEAIIIGRVIYSFMLILIAAPDLTNDQLGKVLSDMAQDLPKDGS